MSKTHGERRNGPTSTSECPHNPQYASRTAVTSRSASPTPIHRSAAALDRFGAEHLTGRGADTAEAGESGSRERRRSFCWMSPTDRTGRDAQEGAAAGRPLPRCWSVREDTEPRLQPLTY